MEANLVEFKKLNLQILDYSKQYGCIPYHYRCFIFIVADTKRNDPRFKQG